jgi:hypothetical protein
MIAWRASGDFAVAPALAMDDDQLRSIAFNGADCGAQASGTRIERIFDWHRASSARVQA